MMEMEAGDSPRKTRQDQELHYVRALLTQSSRTAPNKPGDQRSTGTEMSQGQQTTRT